VYFRVLDQPSDYRLSETLLHAIRYGNVNIRYRHSQALPLDRVLSWIISVQVSKRHDVASFREEL
jgi:hypothetical protein